MRKTETKTTVTCDRCDEVCHEGLNFKHKAHIQSQFNMSNIMWEYSPVPPQPYDLCDDCFVKFTKFMNCEWVDD